ncbi:MAG: RNA 3'-phosphate cyclase [Deltaproteobacteria bacterium]|nr:MAG: RNA 3'-phosphate cyclase [Deltaproteobacteria bacterium]
MIEIDGSYGEGGGQILRTAVAMAAYLGTPCKIKEIRKGRPKPGLRAQHLAGVQALAEVCHAEVEGLQLGSLEVTFKPGKIRAGQLRIDIGTAGAIGLILQTLMLPTIKSPSPLQLNIVGGTDVPWAPTIGYLIEVTLPLLEKIGYRAEMKIIKRGYFPRGGGEVSAQLKGGTLFPVKLLDRGNVLVIKGRSHASQLLKDRRVAERQREGATNILKRSPFPYDIEVEYRDTLSPGSGIDLWAQTGQTVLGSNALGARGKRAEEVGAEAASALLRQIDSGAALDEWMGDQILPFLAVSGGEAIITVPRITDHLRTNLWVIGHFLPITSRITEEKNRVFITISPSS